MENRKIHLLVLKSGNESFYNSRESITQLLGAHDEVNIDANRITINSSLGDSKLILTYEIRSRNITKSNDRSFDIVLNFKELDRKEEILVSRLADILMEALDMIGAETKITLLRHDIYKEYSFEAYKEVFNIENELRQFIYQLMAYKVGYDWIDTVVPDGVETRSTGQQSDQSDFLHQIYLTDLTKILFKGQREADFRTLNLIEQFVRRKQKGKGKTINVSELTGILSTSIWDKYFSDIGEKRNALESKLEKLSKIRNDVAHNKFLSRSELGVVQNLCNSIKKILIVAVKRIDEIEFTNEEVTQTKEIISRVSTGSMFTEMAALEFYLLMIRDKSQEIIKNDRDTGFDAIYINDEGKKTGVELKRSINSHGRAKSIAEQVLNMAKKGSVEYVDLVLVEDNLFTDLEKTINRNIKKIDQTYDLKINVILLSELQAWKNRNKWAENLPRYNSDMIS